MMGIMGWEGGVVTRMRRGEKQAPVRSRRQQQHSLEKLLAPLPLCNASNRRSRKGPHEHQLRDIVGPFDEQD